jgi:hypothetical protein
MWKGRARAVLVRARRFVYGPILTRLDQVDAHLGLLEEIVQASEGRAATMSERYLTLSESEARLARRVKALEEALGQPGS